MKKAITKTFALITVVFTAMFPVLALACNTQTAVFARASSQYASVANNLGIAGGSVTLEGWVKWNSDPLLLFNEGFWGSSDSVSKTFVMFRADSNPDGFICQRGTEGVANNLATYDFTPSLTTWYHVACVYDGSNLTLFWTSTTTHGQYAKVGSTGTGTGAISSETAIGLNVETLGLGSPSQFADAKIDDVRIWNTARTAAQLDANFTTTVSCSSAGLVGYYQMNGDFTDCTSGAHNLTGTNSPTFQSTDLPFNDCVTAAPLNGNDSWYLALLAWKAFHR